HSCVTSRLSEVADGLSVEIMVNIQGDEPLIEPAMIDQVVHEMQASPDVYMATLKKRITNKDDVNNPHVVKVVTDKDGFALYFSRAGIPYEAENRVNVPAPCWYKHIGLYGYLREFLLRIDKLPYSSLETVESLEQLRILENGCKIKVMETEHNTIGVDTPEDLMKVAGMIEKEFAC
ncbi:MAG: 3-deoxy-manno-octulosonate cytidylyltransferase, partial [Candidatus Desantisbacteria bacterium]